MRDLTTEQMTSIVVFSIAHGRTWKSELSRQWMQASASPVLHGLRNTHGPAWLSRFKVPSTNRELS